jgi:transposase
LVKVGVVLGYKSLNYVEQAFRRLRKMDLKIWLIAHWLVKRIRGQGFLSLLTICELIVRAFCPLPLLESVI